MFEVSTTTLLRDKQSTLAQLMIDTYPPIRIPIQDENETIPMISPIPGSMSASGGIGSSIDTMGISTGINNPNNNTNIPSNLEPIQTPHIVTYERDWWLFRYILSFLRDGTLPGDTETSLLISLYKEAAFYNMIELQHAIEDRKLRLRDSNTTTTGSSTNNSNSNNAKGGTGTGGGGDKDELWWKSLPSWFHAVDLVAEAKKEEYKKKAEVSWGIYSVYVFIVCVYSDI